MIGNTSGAGRTRLPGLQGVGQSVWYDNVQRGLFETGELRRLIAAGVTGVTSNPTIFEKAIADSTDYDAAIRGRLDLAPAAIYEALAFADIRAAADLLRQTYDQTAGRDGFVSMEVSPKLADDTAGTITEARRLWAAVDRPNLMVKVPATPAGVPAVAQLVGEGINLNVTLIFSLASYDQVMDAYFTGLERVGADRRSLDRVSSVASFFVSRMDTAVDRRLDARIRSSSDAVEGERLRGLRGQVGIANAVRADARFRAVFAGPRFAWLKAQGAQVQRPLWASTGTKDPSYPDTYYVGALAGFDTVNTMPPATLAAVIDHGQITSRLEDATWADAVVHGLSAADIDLDRITADLLAEGVVSFRRSVEALLTGIPAKRDASRAAAADRVELPNSA